ncbi:acetoacetyl-CoA reductase [Xanthobacter autotrophicus DSM 431]|uniref:acetoacetyl-CoA reductase n=1 Tax=Xanthobacter nonsaccharivorans TaxID=3119912 RepID=UPI0037278279
MRVALVTGGTRGIGAAISIALRDAGYRVAANFGSNAAAAEAFHQRTSIPAFQWDVASHEACRAGVAAVTEALGSVDVLVNNAGITRDRAFHRMSDDDWFAVMNTNLNSAFYMCRSVVAGMRERKFGRIVNISSINGQKGQFGQANYSTAKAGMFGLTKALALEYAKHGITANAIAPGHVDTDMIRAAPPALLDQMRADVPIGRLGTPEEIARCVVFLAADNAGFLTGSTITANGGTYLT